MMRPVRSVVVAFTGLVAFACSSASSSPPPEAPEAPPPPPRICKTPGPPAAQPWFVDATADFGLAKTPTFEPLGGSIVAADLDGDGWVDLVSVQGSSQRGSYVDGTLAGKRLRFVLMNRPAPGDPSRRVFVDTTVESGILATRDGAGERGFGIVNLGDLDGDGDVDILTCPAELGDDKRKVVDPCEALLNDGKGHFALTAGVALGSKVFWVTSAALLDYDRDGILDFWPGTVAHWPYDPTLPDQPPTLFKGYGDGTFTNVSKDVGLPTKDGTPEDGTEWRHVFGVTACDIDGDGDDDMVFADYGRQEAQVWRNDGGHFKNVARELGLDHDDRVATTDDQSYRCYCQANPAACPPGVPAPSTPSFCSVFGGKYGRGWMPGVTDQPYALGGNYFSFACGDIDDDGDMDLMSATIVHGDVGSSADPTELIINPGDGGKFLRPGNASNGLERPENGILWNHGDDLALFVDVDLDGRKDIFTTTTGAYEASDHARLWHQKPDGKFEEIAVAAGIVPAGFKPNLHGPTFVDIDGDGDLDLVIGNVIDGNLRVLRNVAGQNQNFARVRLVGKGAGASNVSAIGAVVRVTAAGRTQTQYVSGGFGHANVEQDLVLTFGLGAACDIDAIEVRWPDAAGTVTRHEHVLSNYTVEIREGERDVRYR
ncbi:MAG TPA: FG-GAP-like repeat-containing protein [Labilithrix sp.]|nr:FG-GAP-like repeat-containing protein [Labilithrix sp.]